MVAALGLFTLALGVQPALAAFGDELAGAVGRSAPLLVLAALLAGGLAGEAVDLEGRLERLGEAVKGATRLSTPAARAARGATADAADGAVRQDLRGRGGRHGGLLSGARRFPAVRTQRGRGSVRNAPGRSSRDASAAGCAAVASPGTVGWREISVGR
jgi:Protein of unknown function (DUF554)